MRRGRGQHSRALLRALKPGAVWQRLNRLSMHLWPGPWFYRLTVRGLAWLFGKRWIQERLFRQQVELMECFLAETRLNTANFPQVMQDSLLIRSRKILKLDLALAQLTQEELASLITIENWHIFQQARDEGRGVLLLWSHVGCPRPFMAYMNGLNLNEVTIGIGRKRRLRESGQECTGTNHLVLFTHDLHTASKVLKKGGVASICPDGRYGTSSIEIPFLNQRRQFKTGFAELVLLTNAIAIPVVITPGGDGTIHARILPPFEYDSLPQSTRRYALIEQYAAHLEQTWRDQPGAIYPNHMARYLRAARVRQVNPVKSPPANGCSLSVKGDDFL